MAKLACPKLQLNTTDCNAIRRFHQNQKSKTRPSARSERLLRKRLNSIACGVFPLPVMVRRGSSRWAPQLSPYRYRTRYTLFRFFSEPMTRGPYPSLRAVPLLLIAGLSADIVQDASRRQAGQVHQQIRPRPRPPRAAASIRTPLVQTTRAYIVKYGRRELTRRLVRRSRPLVGQEGRHTIGAHSRVEEEVHLEGREHRQLSSPLR